MRASAVLVVVALGCSGSGQNASDRASAPPSAVSRIDSLVLLGDSTYRADKDSAKRIWTTALGEASAAGDSANIARALTGLAMVARVHGEWDDSRRLGEQALAIKLRRGMTPKDLFRSYNALGLLAWGEERLNDATSLFATAREAAVAAGDSIALGIVTMNTGLVAQNLGAFDRARRLLEEGRDISRAVGDSSTLGKALNNLAMLDIASGDPLGAMVLLEEARRLARFTGDSVTEVNARGQLATAYNALGETQQALTLLDSALTMAQRHGQTQEVAEDLTLLADLFFEAGDHQHALEYYSRALIATDSLDQPEERGNILRNRAQAYAALGNRQLAAEGAVEALAIHRQGGFTYPELDDLIVLARLAQKDGKRAESEDHLGAAQRLAAAMEAPIAQARVAIATAAVAADARQWERVLRTINQARPTLYLTASTEQADALMLRARALGELGQNEAAVAAGQQAIKAVEQLRNSYAAGELRTSYVSEKASVFAYQALLLLRLGRTAEAFEVADAARGRALLEHLTQARADVGSSGAVGDALAREALLRRIDALLGLLRDREQTPPRERSSEFVGETSGLRRTVDSLRAEYTALVARNATASTSSFAGLARPSPKEISDRLGTGEVLLEYLVTDDRLLIFAVTQDRVSAYFSNESAASLSSRVQLARELLRRPGDDAKGVLRALYDIVLGPVAKAGLLGDSTRLIVVPHGVLTYLPFAALVDSTGDYLVKRHALLYLATSAVLPVLRRSQVAQSQRAERATEVFAPVPGVLHATKVEAEAIRKIIRGSSVHMGAKATEGRLRVALGRGGVVHVATHATLNSRNPLFSYVQLADVKNPIREDNGRLEVHELLGLRLDAALVFLSGCETAVGSAWSTRFDTGEDYATIGQSLLFAGVRSVVATLWRIDDNGAAEFAKRFYESGSRDYVEDLATAQRQMIKDARYGTPYYWAAYQISGTGLTEPSANSGVVSDKR